MEQQIRAVLFDMDGLMFDTERLGDEVWRAVAGKYGVTTTHMPRTSFRPSRSMPMAMYTAFFTIWPSLRTW